MSTPNPPLGELAPPAPPHPPPQPLHLNWVLLGKTSAPAGPSHSGQPWISSLWALGMATEAGRRPLGALLGADLAQGKSQLQYAPVGSGPADAALLELPLAEVLRSAGWWQCPFWLCQSSAPTPWPWRSCAFTALIVLPSPPKSAGLWATSLALVPSLSLPVHPGLLGSQCPLVTAGTAAARPYPGLGASGDWGATLME